MFIGRTVDHIVYAVPNLEQACDELEKGLGIRPVFGGYHQTQGTKNALLNLGNGAYLELLAVDMENKVIPPPRWMGVDLIDKARITRWALKSQNLESDSTYLQSYNSELGKIQGGQRKTQDGSLLKWQLIMPTSTPMMDVLPFMVDWQESSHHPTDRLAEVCPLLEVKIAHPQAEKIQTIFEQLGVQLEVKKGAEKIEIVLEGRKGHFRIS